MKAKFENREEYCIGISGIDRQHEYFFMIINRLKKMFSEPIDKKILKNLTEELVLYSKFHFKSEENIMSLINYPKLEEHRLIHYKLMEDLGAAKMSFEIIEKDGLKLTIFLERWLISHIMGEDQKLGRYYKQEKRSSFLSPTLSTSDLNNDT